MCEFSNSQKEFLETLFVKLNTTIDQKSAEIRSELEEVKKEVSKKFVTLHTKIDTLENQNKKLKETVLQLERKVRKKNVALYGLDNNEEDLVGSVCNIFQDTLGLKISEEDLSDVYFIGSQRENSRPPVIIEFISYRKKLLVLKNAKKLKGSNIYIAKDQCLEDRKVNKILVQHLKEARRKGVVAYIRGNKLFVSNEPYTVEQLEEKTVKNSKEINIEEQEEEAIGAERSRSNSAPPTPSPATKHKRQIEESEIEQIKQKKPKAEDINKSKFVLSTMKTRSNSATNK